MPIGGEPVEEDGDRVNELLEEFRNVPDEWKEEAVRQIELIRRLSTQPPARFIGEEEGDHDPDQDNTT